MLRIASQLVFLFEGQLQNTMAFKFVMLALCLIHLVRILIKVENVGSVEKQDIKSRHVITE